MRDLKIEHEEGMLHIESVHILDNGTIAPLVYIYCLLVIQHVSSKTFNDVVMFERL